MSSDHISAEAAIEAGRQQYAAMRYKPALEQFTRAMKLCPCARGMKRERCSCKNYEKVASKGGSIFKEAMYNCKCPVGQTFNKCDKATHIQALDYRAATFEAMEELDRARKDAEWIIELAPRLPDGYLRLGKIARLQNNPGFAWKIYNAGVEAAVSSGTAKSQKMEQLYKARQPLHRKFVHKDPMRLPMEIIQNIFSSMDLANLVRCLRVSKIWKETLTARGNERLWRSLIFIGPTARRRAPQIDALRKLLAYSHNDVRKLVIANGKRFLLTQSKFLALLGSSKNLEHLELSTPYERLNLPISLPKLKHLVLAGFDCLDPYPSIGPSYLHKFVVKAAPNLENLCLSGVPLEWTSDMPMMPNLRFLKLEKNEHQESSVPIIEIFDHAPHLEQLCLDSVKVDDSIFHTRKWEHRGPNIKVVRIVERSSRSLYNLLYLEDDRRSSDSAGAYQLLLALNGGKPFQHLDISYQWEYTDTSFRRSEILDGGYGKPFYYGNLQSLRLGSMALCPEAAERMFGNALRQGKLHTFDIVFPPDTLHGQAGQLSTQHLEGYDWLKGAESIRHMGIFGFSFSLLYHDEKEMPLLKFLASFPNLESLEMDSNNYDVKELFMLIRDILMATHLKTLYHKVNGAMMDKLRRLARNCGVKLVSGERPRQWPVPLDQ